MPERFECTTLAKKCYINTLPFLSFYYAVGSVAGNLCTCNDAVQVQLTDIC